MKKSIGIRYILFFSLMMITFGLSAQTVTLKFTGRDAGNHYVRLNKVVIKNQTKNWQETIWWPDTVLTMQNGTGIDDYTENGDFALSQNNPNPFSGTTDVTLTIAEEGGVILLITDMNGRTIVETQNFASLQPGIHQFRISLSTVGTYVMTARKKGKTSSIKMICNRRGETNSIDYLGEAQSLTYMLKSTTNKPFNYGDMMEYIGYATINGTTVESQHITQEQGSSQTFTLQFPASQQQGATIILEAHDVWGDNSGYQLLLDADATAYGTIIPVSGPLTSSGNASAATYAAFEYKIPQNADGSTTTSNMVVDGSVTITIPAGTYDFCITNPTPGDRIWIASSMYGRQDNFTFQINQTYHFYIEMNGSHDSVILISSANLPPTVTTNEVTNITSTSATCGGNVISNGGANVTARGVCWSTSQAPTVNDSHTSNNSGMGSFTSSITGLTANTTYYVRAYATNSAGTVYGEQRSFTTTGTVSPPCNVSDQCGYTFYLTDSYGDGWNNGFLSVVQNGVTVANITLTSGSSGTETVMLCDNQSTSLVWIPGSYDSEVGFSLEDNFGNVVCSYSAGSMSSYTTYTFTADCQGTANLPNAPTGVTATNVGTSSYPQIEISWNPVSNATSYKVYRSSTVSGTYSQIGSATSNTYLYDNNPLSGHNYYKVKAVNSAGESSYSSYAHYNNTGGGTTVPNAPTGVTVTNVGTSSDPQIEISWNSVSNATSYKVYRSATASGTYSQIGSATSNTYLYDNNPLSGHNYYKVKAVNSAGESSYSSYAHYNNTGGGSTVPNAPTGVTATNTTIGSTAIPVIYISWNSVANATSYKVYRSSSASGTYSQIGSATSETYLYDNYPLSGNNYYKVKAVNSAGESTYSSYASCYFNPSNVAPCAPSVNVGGTISQTLHWTDNNGTGCGTPTSFQVLQRIPCTNAYAQIATTTSHYYTNYDVHPGINRYKVVAINSAGSEESAVASSSSVPLSSPGTLWIDGLGGNCVQFTWSGVDWASRYEIQYSTNGNNYHSDITINNGSQTTTTNCYPQFSGIVYFRIRAVFDDCSSIDDPVYSSWSTGQVWF